MPRAVERDALKAQQRLENRRRWQQNPLNVNRKHVALMEETCPIPEELPPVSGIDSLAKLKEIMLDSSVPLARRLRAAQHLLRYEMAPGAAHGLEAATINSSAYQFLTRVASSTAADELKQVAIETLASAENARAKFIDPLVTSEGRRLMRELLAARRRHKLVEARSWPPPPDWLADINALDDTEIQRLIEDARL